MAGHLCLCHVLQVSSCKEYSFEGAGTERDESSVWSNVLASLRYEQSNTKVVFGEVWWGTNKSMRGKRQPIGLEQPQLPRSCDRFGAPLDPEFAKDFQIVPLYGPQSQKQPLADLLIGESGSNQMQDFQLAL